MKVLKAIGTVLEAQEASGKPLAVVVAGHNGSGKSTFWYEVLADTIRIPLVNADRMMLSILPEERPLPAWALKLRDEDASWMKVAQKGVEAFVAQAMANAVPFAMETVFSHCRMARSNPRSTTSRGCSRRAISHSSSSSGWGTSSSPWRVLRCVELGGHNVPEVKLRERFPRTQRAIAAALDVVDAALLVDNSRDLPQAFTVSRVELNKQKVYDLREGRAPKVIRAWLDVIRPENG